MLLGQLATLRCRTEELPKFYSFFSGWNCCFSWWSLVKRPAWMQPGQNPWILYGIRRYPGKPHKSEADTSGKVCLSARSYGTRATHSTLWKKYMLMVLSRRLPCHSLHLSHTPLHPYAPALHCNLTSHHLAVSLTFPPFLCILTLFSLSHFPLSLFVLVLLLFPASSVCVSSTFNQNLTSTIGIIFVPSPSHFYYLSFAHWFCIISLISSPAVFLISILYLPLCP